MPFPMAVLNPYGKRVSKERGEEGVRLAEHPLRIYLLFVFFFLSCSVEENWISAERSNLTFI